MAQYINDVETHILRTNLILTGKENLIFTYDDKDRESIVGISMMADSTMKHICDKHFNDYENSNNDVDKEGSHIGDYIDYDKNFLNNIVASFNLDEEEPSWCPIATVDDLPEIKTITVDYDYNIIISDEDPSIDMEWKE